MLHLKQTLHKYYTTTYTNFISGQERFEVTWSCSPKLSVSGEPWDTAIKA